MSHSSGIPVSTALKNAFSTTKRVIKVQIVNEEMVPVGEKGHSGKSWEQDLDLVTGVLEIDQPSYILFNKSPENNEWILFCYVPDKSKVKDKMLYASSRAALKQQLGSGYFIDDVFGTVPGDFSLKGYSLHVTSKKTDSPLTESEQIRQSEMESGPVYSGGTTTYVHGVAFPVDSAVTQAVKKLLSGQLSYVQCAVDISQEKIILDHTDKIEFTSLAFKIPLAEPRFHFFSYTHSFEDQTVTSIVYIYSCPDGSKGTTSAPVKQRMLYSSSKANVSELINAAGGTIAVRLEVNAGEDIVEDEVFRQIHPTAPVKAQTFSRPMRPGKGARKLIKEDLQKS